MHCYTNYSTKGFSMLKSIFGVWLFTRSFEILYMLLYITSTESKMASSQLQPSRLATSFTTSSDDPSTSINGSKNGHQSIIISTSFNCHSSLFDSCSAFTSAPILIIPFSSSSLSVRLSLAACLFTCCVNGGDCGADRGVPEGNHPRILRPPEGIDSQLVMLDFRQGDGYPINSYKRTIMFPEAQYIRRYPRKEIRL